MKKFKATNADQKLHSEADFEVIFWEYLQMLDLYDAQTRNYMDKTKHLRYHVEQGLEEHPELVKRIYQKYEDQKQKVSSKKSKLG